MKSIKMFGRSVPLLAIVMASMLVIGGSASLINYLSNTITADTAVVSPIVLVDSTFTMDGSYAGTTVYLTIEGTSYADHPIPVTFDLYCTYDDGGGAVTFDGVGITVDVGNIGADYWLVEDGDLPTENNDFSWNAANPWVKDGVKGAVLGPGHVIYNHPLVDGAIAGDYRLVLDEALAEGTYTFTLTLRPWTVPTGYIWDTGATEDHTNIWGAPNIVYGSPAWVSSVSYSGP